MCAVQDRQAMSFLKSVPPDEGLLEIFQAFPETARPLLEYHEVLLRGDSPFTAAERELMAAQRLAQGDYAQLLDFLPQ